MSTYAKRPKLKKKIYKKKWTTKVGHFNKGKYDFYTHPQRYFRGYTVYREICLDIILNIPNGFNTAQIYYNPSSFNAHEVVTAYSSIYDYWCMKSITLQVKLWPVNIDAVGGNIIQDLILWTEDDPVSDCTTNERRLQKGYRPKDFLTMHSISTYPYIYRKKKGDIFWARTSESLGQSPNVYTYVQMRDNSGVGGKNVAWVTVRAVVGFKEPKF